MAGQVHGCASTGNKNSHEHTHIFDKTRLCKFYVKGKCKRGQACTFAHGDTEVQPQPDFFRTQLCVDFVRSGMCALGSSCKYAHSPQEIRRAKTQKSSKSQGLKKAADPQVTLEVHRLEIMQQEVHRLQSQLQVLKTITGHPVPDAAHASRSRAPSDPTEYGSTGVKLVVEGDEDKDVHDHYTGFSRQSTEEGSAELGLPLLPFSRQSSFETDAFDEWEEISLEEGTFLAELEEVGSAEEEEEQKEEVAYELFVSNTFITCKPAKAAGSHRRSQSTPAALRFALA